jgi:hypothetical protein
LVLFPASTEKAYCRDQPGKSSDKAEGKAIKTQENRYLPKLEEYKRHLAVLGKRNGYSKTDPAAAFMRPPERQFFYKNA